MVSEMDPERAPEGPYQTVVRRALDVPWQRHRRRRDRQRRQSGRVTRALARLRAHCLIKKVGGSYRYKLTRQGR